MTSLYTDVLNLMSIENDQERGYKFEQVIREILPWEYLPPIAATTKSEQLDAIFIYKNQPFLVEAKAKKNKITPGSHDWEDFAHKIYQRKNNVIGLFISLFELSEDIFNVAIDLIKQGNRVIVVDISFWRDIANDPIPFSHVLDYMNLHGRIKLFAKVPRVSIMMQWLFNKEQIEKEIKARCIKNASTFLSRFKNASHDSIYVTREIDENIVSYTNELKPSSLIINRQESNKIGDNDLSSVKDELKVNSRKNPRQLCLLRDYSGSGKTTFSIQQSLKFDVFYGTGVAANESDIDIKFQTFIESLGIDYGITKLRVLNKPLVFIIDSLDEASSSHATKRREIIALLRFLENTLNPAAVKEGFINYPILLIFTVREDYWRDWENLFEGRLKYELKKRISQFSKKEFPLAQKKYERFYNYEITNVLTPASETVLSYPINLLIFSETNQYKGEVSVADIWETSVLDKFFSKKQEDIFKRPILGFNSDIFLKLISSLAFISIVEKRNFISKKQIEKLINLSFGSLTLYIDEIILIISSEQIIVKDPESADLFRFRHNRFIEYLMAYYIVVSVNKELNIGELDNLTQVSFDSGVVQMFRIHDDIRHISKNRFPNTVKLIEDYYSTSSLYLKKCVLHLRSLVSIGKTVPKEDLDLILKNANKNDADLVYDSFFVIASRNNKAVKRDILNLFLLGFSSEKNYNNRYKMVQKLSYHECLLEEKIALTILASSNPKDWEVYLWAIIQSNMIKEFRCLWEEADGDYYLSKVSANCEQDWILVKKLRETIKTEKKFVIGDFE